MERFGTDKDEKIINNKFIFISFFCSILVIYIHTFNLETYSINEGAVGIAKVAYVVETYWTNVLKIAVPMFFFISGILFLEHLRCQSFYKNGIPEYLQLLYLMVFGVLSTMYIMFCVRIFLR